MGDFFRSLEEIVDPRHTCVLIVDMQNDFCSKNGVMDLEGQSLDLIREMVPNLKCFLDHTKATRAKTVYLQNAHDDEHINPANLELDHRKGRIPQRTVRGTWGWEIIPELNPSLNDKIFPKYRYSAFTNKEFRHYLRDHGILSIIVTGVGTAVCVESTVRDAFMANYYVVVLRDCVAAYSKDTQKFSLQIMERNFGRIVNSDDVIECWNPRK